MSTARAVLTFAAAAVVLPLAMRARATAVVPTGFVSANATIEEEGAQANANDLHAYLEGMRGANAIQCEIALSSFNSWSSSRSPDRDSTAWNIGMVVHRRIASPALVSDLVTAMRSGDACVSRLAARLLGRSRLDQARSALMTALRDENPDVRQLGAIGIGFTEDSTATSPLVRALADRDARVRAAAAWALGAVSNN